MRRIVQGSTAVSQETAAASSNGLAPAIGIVVAGCASLLLWVVLLLLARWIATTLL